MALVLRNAILPKNIVSLKWFKGHSMTTMMQKKQPALPSTAICRRRMEIAIPTRSMKIEVKRLVSVKQRGRQRYRQRHTSLRYSMSCPSLMRRAKIVKPLRHYSSCRTEPVCDGTRTLPSPMGHSDKPRADMARRIVCACKCPCPFPCGPCGNCCGCNCLPPPCNTPPKCVQYMTGYYYYPYGIWFCGPYHVTNLCCPVGPCSKCSCPFPCP